MHKLKCCRTSNEVIDLVAHNSESVILYEMISMVSAMLTLISCMFISTKRISLFILNYALPVLSGMHQLSARLV